MPCDVQAGKVPVDHLSLERRSWNMGRIRSKNTRPELRVRSLVHRMGYRFRVHQCNLPGKPDIVLKKHGIVIFVHGCFWHQHKGCVEASSPKTNTTYWCSKLQSNVDRDRRTRSLLRRRGWRVFRFWECEVEKHPLRLERRIARALNPGATAAGANSLHFGRQEVTDAQWRCKRLRRLKADPHGLSRRSKGPGK